jgi:hypothetical protein
MASRACGGGSDRRRLEDPVVVLTALGGKESF